MNVLYIDIMIQIQGNDAYIRCLQCKGEFEKLSFAIVRVSKTLSPHRKSIDSLIWLGRDNEGTRDNVTYPRNIGIIRLLLREYLNI